MKTLDCLGHLRKYSCLAAYTNASWFYTADPELPVFKIWLPEPLRSSPQTCMWHFTLNVTEQWLWNCLRNHSPHSLQHLNEWQPQSRSSLDLKPALRCQQSLSPRPSKYMCNLTTAALQSCTRKTQAWVDPSSTWDFCNSLLSCRPAFFESSPLNLLSSKAAGAIHPPKAK